MSLNENDFNNLPGQPDEMERIVDNIYNDLNYEQGLFNLVEKSPLIIGIYDDKLK